LTLKRKLASITLLVLIVSIAIFALGTSLKQEEKNPGTMTWDRPVDNSFSNLEPNPCYPNPVREER
jgi:hypothetical protein